MFLARGKVGPFRVDAEPIAGSDGVMAVRTVLHDEGDGDRPITAGSYQLRASDSLARRSLTRMRCRRVLFYAVC